MRDGKKRGSIRIVRQGEGKIVCTSAGTGRVDGGGKKAKEKEVNNGVGTEGMKNEGDA